MQLQTFFEKGMPFDISERENHSIMNFPLFKKDFFVVV